MNLLLDKTKIPPDMICVFGFIGEWEWRFLIETFLTA